MQVSGSIHNCIARILCNLPSSIHQHWLLAAGMAACEHHGNALHLCLCWCGARLQMQCCKLWSSTAVFGCD